jgi:hypothetical protein
MSAFSRFYKARLPGAVTEAFVWLQLHVGPSRFYRHRAAVLRALQGPRAVMGGPFHGMVYARHSADKALLPRLLGTYECELHAAVEDLCTRRPDRIAIAGAAEGYYAVGLARRLPAATVFAYDGLRWARHLLGQMAARNHLADRVRIGGLVTPAELERVLQPAARPALVSDVEGYEITLVDPVAVPALRRATILLELHENFVPGVTAEMYRRFQATHAIAKIDDRPRTLSDLPAGISLPASEALWAMNEAQFRGVRQSWLYLTPR